MRLLLVLLLFLVACSGLGPVSGLVGSNQPPTGTLPVSQTATAVAIPPTTVEPSSTSPHLAITDLAPTKSTPAVNRNSGFPDLGAYTWTLVVGGLTSPVGLANAGDGSGRLFVLERAGRVRIIKDGNLTPTPFLDIVDQVGSAGDEQGLLGIAFHPHYTQNGYFFVNFTNLKGDTIIARFQVSKADPDRADPRSKKNLFIVKQPYVNHNGGMVAFGPDGYLYLGLGDGGSGGDPQGNGQSLTTLLGKILRIDVDHGDPYAIPPDNPYANGGGKPEIWALGLRNPWRFSFDRLTGDLFIGDVGQSHWEEIDYLPSGTPGGANFGWNFFEGSHAFKGSPRSGLDFVNPIVEYDHTQGCSVTGGVVYRGSDLLDWQGVYLYGDYCSGTVWGLFLGSQGTWKSASLFKNVGRIVSFGEDETGAVYLVDYAGQVFTLRRK